MLEEISLLVSPSDKSLTSSDSRGESATLDSRGGAVTGEEEGEEADDVAEFRDTKPIKIALSSSGEKGFGKYALAVEEGGEGEGIRLLYRVSRITLAIMSSLPFPFSSTHLPFDTQLFYHPSSPSQ